MNNPMSKTTKALVAALGTLILAPVLATWLGSLGGVGVDWYNWQVRLREWTARTDKRLDTIELKLDTQNEEILRHLRKIETNTKEKK